MTPQPTHLKPLPDLDALADANIQEATLEYFEEDFPCLQHIPSSSDLDILADNESARALCESMDEMQEHLCHPAVEHPNHVPYFFPEQNLRPATSAWQALLLDEHIARWALVPLRYRTLARWNSTFHETCAELHLPPYFTPDVQYQSISDIILDIIKSELVDTVKESAKNFAKSVNWVEVTSKTIQFVAACDALANAVRTRGKAAVALHVASFVSHLLPFAVFVCDLAGILPEQGLFTFFKEKATEFFNPKNLSELSHSATVDTDYLFNELTSQPAQQKLDWSNVLKPEYIFRAAVVLVLSIFAGTSFAKSKNMNAGMLYTAINAGTTLASKATTAGSFLICSLFGIEMPHETLEKKAEELETKATKITHSDYATQAAYDDASLKEYITQCDLALKKCKTPETATLKSRFQSIKRDIEAVRANLGQISAPMYLQMVQWNEYTFPSEKDLNFASWTQDTLEKCIQFNTFMDSVTALIPERHPVSPLYRSLKSKSEVVRRILESRQRWITEGGDLCTQPYDRILAKLDSWLQTTAAAFHTEPSRYHDFDADLNMAQALLKNPINDHTRHAHSMLNSAYVKAKQHLADLVKDAAQASRPPTVVIQLVSEFGHGKSRLTTDHLIPDVANLLGISPSTYFINISENGHWSRYLGQNFAICDEYLRCMSKDALFKHIAEIASNARFDVNSAEIAGKGVPFQSKVLFLNSNQTRCTFPELSPDHVDAIHSRIMTIQVFNPEWAKYVADCKQRGTVPIRTHPVNRDPKRVKFALCSFGTANEIVSKKPLDYDNLVKFIARLIQDNDTQRSTALTTIDDLADQITQVTPAPVNYQFRPDMSRQGVAEFPDLRPVTMIEAKNKTVKNGALSCIFCKGAHLSETCTQFVQGPEHAPRWQAGPIDSCINHLVFHLYGKPGFGKSHTTINHIIPALQTLTKLRSVKLDSFNEVFETPMIVFIDDMVLDDQAGYLRWWSAQPVSHIVVLCSNMKAKSDKWKTRKDYFRRALSKSKEESRFFKIKELKVPGVVRRLGINGYVKFDDNWESTQSGRCYHVKSGCITTMDDQLIDLDKEIQEFAVLWHKFTNTVYTILPSTDIPNKADIMLMFDSYDEVTKAFASSMSVLKAASKGKIVVRPGLTGCTANVDLSEMKLPEEYPISNLEWTRFASVVSRVYTSAKSVFVSIGDDIIFADLATRKILKNSNLSPVQIYTSSDKKQVYVKDASGKRYTYDSEKFITRVTTTLQDVSYWQGLPLEAIIYLMKNHQVIIEEHFPLTFLKLKKKARRDRNMQIVQQITNSKAFQVGFPVAVIGVAATAIFGIAKLSSKKEKSPKKPSQPDSDSSSSESESDEEQSAPQKSEKSQTRVARKSKQSAPEKKERSSTKVLRKQKQSEPEHNPKSSTKVARKKPQSEPQKSDKSSTKVARKLMQTILEEDEEVHQSLYDFEVTSRNPESVDTTIRLLAENYVKVKGFGSNFGIILGNGFILTTLHTVRMNTIDSLIEIDSDTLFSAPATIHTTWEGSDLALLKCPKATGKTLLKHWVTNDDIHKLYEGAMISPNSSRGVDTFNGRFILFPQKRRLGQYHDERTVSIDFVRSDIVTRAGDCGSAYISTQKDVRGHIFALHACLQNGRSHGAYIGREDLQDAMQSTPRRIPQSSPTPAEGVSHIEINGHEILGTTSQVDFLVQKFGSSDAPRMPLPKDAIELGRLAKTPPETAKSRKIPITQPGMQTTCSKVPVSTDLYRVLEFDQMATELNGKPSHLATQIAKHGMTPDLNIDEGCLRRATSLVAYRYVSAMAKNGRQLSTLSLQQTFGGIKAKGKVTLDKLTNDTSAGFLSLYLNKAPLKDAYVKVHDDGRVEPTELGIKTFQDANNILARGKDYPNATLLSIGHCKLKSELLPAQKIEQGQLRCFVAEGIESIIPCRSKLGSFVAMQNELRHDLFPCIGIDFETESSYLLHRLLSVNDTIQQGDFKRFDKTMPIELKRAACEVVEKCYMRNPLNRYDAPARRVLYNTWCSPLYLARDLLMTTGNGQPSGNAMTATLNSIVSEIAYTYCLFRHADEHNLRLNTGDFTMIIYGDDWVAATKTELMPSADKLISYMSEIGLTLTSPIKTEPLKDFYPIEEMEFCSRTFHEHTSLVVLARLKKSSIEALLHYCYSLTSEAVQDNVRTALQFAVSYDEEYYNLILHDAQILVAHYGGTLPQPYEMAFSALLGKIINKTNTKREFKRATEKQSLPRKDPRNDRSSSCPDLTKLTLTTSHSTIPCTQVIVDDPPQTSLPNEPTANNLRAEESERVHHPVQQVLLHPIQNCESVHQRVDPGKNNMPGQTPHALSKGNPREFPIPGSRQVDLSSAYAALAPPEQETRITSRVSKGGDVPSKGSSTRRPDSARSNMPASSPRSAPLNSKQRRLKRRAAERQLALPTYHQFSSSLTGVEDDGAIATSSPAEKHGALPTAWNKLRVTPLPESPAEKQSLGAPSADAVPQMESGAPAGGNGPAPAIGPVHSPSLLQGMITLAGTAQNLLNSAMEFVMGTPLQIDPSIAAWTVIKEVSLHESKWQNPVARLFYQLHKNRSPAIDIKVEVTGAVFDVGKLATCIVYGPPANGEKYSDLELQQHYLTLYATNENNTVVTTLTDRRTSHFARTDEYDRELESQYPKLLVFVAVPIYNTSGADTPRIRIRVGDRLHPSSIFTMPNLPLVRSLTSSGTGMHQTIPQAYRNLKIVIDGAYYIASTAGSHLGPDINGYLVRGPSVETEIIPHAGALTYSFVNANGTEYFSVYYGAMTLDEAANSYKDEVSVIYDRNNGLISFEATEGDILDVHQFNGTLQHGLGTHIRPCYWVRTTRFPFLAIQPHDGKHDNTTIYHFAGMSGLLPVLIGAKDPLVPTGESRCLFQQFSSSITPGNYAGENSLPFAGTLDYAFAQELGIEDDEAVVALTDRTTDSTLCYLRWSGTFKSWSIRATPYLASNFNLSSCYISHITREFSGKLPDTDLSNFSSRVAPEGTPQKIVRCRTDLAEAPAERQGNLISTSMQIHAQQNMLDKQLEQQAWQNELNREYNAWNAQQSRQHTEFLQTRDQHFKAQMRGLRLGNLDGRDIPAGTQLSVLPPAYSEHDPFTSSTKPKEGNSSSAQPKEGNSSPTKPEEGKYPLIPFVKEGTFDDMSMSTFLSESTPGDEEDLAMSDPPIYSEQSQAIMKQMGHKEGEGLGKQSQGITSPIQPDYSDLAGGKRYPVLGSDPTPANPSGTGLKSTKASIPPPASLTGGTAGRVAARSAAKTALKAASKVHPALIAADVATEVISANPTSLGHLAPVQPMQPTVSLDGR